jgi:transcriptional regulator with XRE-family HTH domain
LLFNITMQLWEIISEIREKSHLNKKEFATRIGVTPTYAAQIERPSEETGSTPSEELLKRIAEAFSSSDEERQELEERLLNARTMLDVTPKMRELVVGSQNVSMPEEFIQRVRGDVARLSGSKIAHLTLRRAQIDRLLRGEIRLDKAAVIQLARDLNQPTYDYLLLADYIPKAFSAIFKTDAGKKLLAEVEEHYAETEQDGLSPEEKENFEKMVNEEVERMANTLVHIWEVIKDARK